MPNNKGFSSYKWMQLLHLNHRLKQKGADEVEQDLITHAQAGEREAIIQILRELETPLYRTAYYWLKNEQDALDATQEALLNVYRHLPTYKGDASLRTWAQRIVVNVCIDHCRKHKKVVPLEDERQEDMRASRVVELRHMTQDIQQAIDRLPELQRTAIILRYIQEYQYQEIAEVMQLPLNTVKSHLFRARKQLHEWLGEYQERGIKRWEMKASRNGSNET